MMKLTRIFRDLEQLYEIMIFKKLAMAASLFFKMRPKFCREGVNVAQMIYKYLSTQLALFNHVDNTYKYPKCEIK